MMVIIFFVVFFIAGWIWANIQTDINLYGSLKEAKRFRRYWKKIHR